MWIRQDSSKTGKLEEHLEKELKIVKIGNTFWAKEDLPQKYHIEVRSETI